MAAAGNLRLVVEVTHTFTTWDAALVFANARSRRSRRRHSIFRGRAAWYVQEVPA